MIGSRLKQFREYNGFHIDSVAEILGISTENYLKIENGTAPADIDVLSKLAVYYRVTVDELYGYTPRIALHDKSIEQDDGEVSQRLLKMADLSWDEAQIILYYRSINDTDGFKDDLVSEIIKRTKLN